MGAIRQAAAGIQGLRRPSPGCERRTLDGGNSCFGSAMSCTASSGWWGRRGKGWGSVTRKSPETAAIRATNARLVRELDMRWETFQRTVFARQKDVAALDLSGTSDARRRHVERLLGLEAPPIRRRACVCARQRARCRAAGASATAPQISTISRAQCEQAGPWLLAPIPPCYKPRPSFRRARTVVGRTAAIRRRASSRPATPS